MFLGGSVTEEVFQQIADTARKLYEQSTGDTGTVLHAIVKSAVDEIPGAQHAGITTAVNGAQLDTRAATGCHASTIDEIQVAVREGPSMTAAKEKHPVLFVDDVAADDRWSAYRDAVLEHTPIRSLMSYRLFTGGRTLGALNVYAEQANAFSSEAKELGRVVATHAALAWDSARRQDNFRIALASRDMIGQAKGILMERFDTDSEASFELLRQMSQDSNIPVKDVARIVVEERGAKLRPERPR
ncbi:ANTAR domain-containing protein [Mycolicibacterium moriokaense]|nr:ANTAR domain-containing protein [Mycolicibacterium moriokaense]